LFSIIAQVFLLSIALSADAAAVAVSTGAKASPFMWAKAARLALFFAVFQAIMPLLGWLAGVKILDFIANWDHWVAGIVLAFIGGKMIKESFAPAAANKNCKLNGSNEDSTNITDKYFTWGTLLILAIATSIDALAVGLTFPVFGLNTPISVVLAAISIGTVTFTLSLAGVYAGHKGAAMFGNKIELAGGIILIAIGFRVIYGHCFA